MPPCQPCIEERKAQAALRGQAEPREGVSVTPAAAGELDMLRKLWDDRSGRPSHAVEAAWVVDNPLLTYKYHQRRTELKAELRREPDELQGYHGTHPTNVLSIAQKGFNSNLRAGQVYGAGEYFAKDPLVSMGYSKGGMYMFVCRLCLGVQSSSQANRDGDHIWAEGPRYYVISHPAQVLPQYIVKFGPRCDPTGGSFGSRYNLFGSRYDLTGGVVDSELERVLAMTKWSTKREQTVTHIPPNRPCGMEMPSTIALWMGFLHATHSDDSLQEDVKKFFENHAKEYTAGIKVHIASGKYKKAHVTLPKAMPRDLVHALNKLPFVEGGQTRTITVDDAHGSPSQACPRWIAGYCRGRNLRFTHSCWCSHKARPTEKAKYKLVNVSLASAKGVEIVDKFMSSSPFHDGSRPAVVKIEAIQNDTLSHLHEEYRAYLRNKNKEEPTIRELWHGTNNNIVKTLCTHGLQPPSDTQASDECPVSGGKGLCTTLCNNDCKYCTKKHNWNRCHMYGLGIYLADLAQKSHRYNSQPEMLPSGKRRFKMLLCSVLGRALEVKGHLRMRDAMHDVVNVRAIADDLKGMIEPHDCCLPCNRQVEGADLLVIAGLGGACRPGMSVVNPEYIAYHPYQCLPRYQITYDC